MHRRLNCLTMAVVSLTTATATAQVTSFTLDSANTGSGQNITIDFDGQFTGSQFLVTLTEGTLTSAANLFPVPGEENADLTFIANGIVPVGFSTAPSIAGPAVNLGTVNEGAAVATTTLFDVTAFTPPAQQGPANQDGVDFIIARIGGLSADAQGSFSFLASVNGVIFTQSGDIVDGVAVIPEPATAALLGLAGLGLATRRRQKM